MKEISFTKEMQFPSQINANLEAKRFPHASLHQDKKCRIKWIPLEQSELLKRLWFIYWPSNRFKVNSLQECVHCGTA